MNNPAAADPWDDDAAAGAMEFAPIEFEPPQLALLDMERLASREPPARQWAVPGWIPSMQASLLTGPGSAGKSLLAQQLCTCKAMGRPFLGMEIERAPALYITCEDDGDELERREKDICNALTIARSDLKGHLHLASLQGKLGNELVEFHPSGRMIISETYRRLEATAVNLGVRFVALDNVAHFTAEEIARSKVAAFVNLLNRLALTIGGAVLLLGHPNKLWGADKATSGGEFSGSTAWENQVRSRLFMQEPKAELDPDMKVLRRAKSNYARKGEEIEFRWHQGAFVKAADLPPDTGRDLANVAAATAHNERFLSCLKEVTRQARNVSEKGGRNFAPKAFSAMPEAKGSTKDDMQLAMDRLFRLGRIERAELWRGPDRKPVYGLRETRETPTAEQQP